MTQANMQAGHTNLDQRRELSGPRGKMARGKEAVIAINGGEVKCALMIFHLNLA